jgi:nucleoid-associated protein YgaU
VDWPSDRTSAPAGDWSAAAPQTSAVPPIIWPTDAAGTTTARAGNAPQTVAVQTPKPTPSPRAAGPASTLAPKHSPAGAGHSQIDPPDATTPIVRTPTAGSRPNVRVTAGDSLWLIAAHRLGPKATEAEIAGAWPQWYAANHRAIGDNPNALTPGARLSVPDAKD